MEKTGEEGESDERIQRQVQHMVITMRDRSGSMLKIRLMGTKKDIAWFQKIMQDNPGIRVKELSETYPNKGTKQYYRSYAEVEECKETR